MCFFSCQLWIATEMLWMSLDLLLSLLSIKTKNCFVCSDCISMVFMQHKMVWLGSLVWRYFLQLLHKLYIRYSSRTYVVLSLHINYKYIFTYRYIKWGPMYMYEKKIWKMCTSNKARFPLISVVLMLALLKSKTHH